MHELGIVFHAIDILEETARQHGISRITRVTLELGEVSGVVTEFFEDAWKWATDKRDLLRDAQLDIKTLPAITVCNSCGRTYPTVAHGRICPYCQSEDTELLCGRELNIAEIECPDV